MEEKNTTNQLENSAEAQVETPLESPESVRDIKHFKFMDDKPRLKSAILAAVLIVAIVGTLFLYWKLIRTDLLKGNGQPGDQINLTDKEKEDILKSLGSDTFSDMSGSDKHKELDQLTEQSKNDPKLREFEKVEILDRLSQ